MQPWLAHTLQRSAPAACTAFGQLFNVRRWPQARPHVAKSSVSGPHACCGPHAGSLLPSGIALRLPAFHATHTHLSWQVADYWLRTGPPDNLTRCRFHLTRLPGQGPMPRADDGGPLQAR